MIHKEQFADDFFQGGAAAIQMAVQVNIIKYLLFVQNKEENIHLQRYETVPENISLYYESCRRIRVLYTAPAYSINRFFVV